MRIRFVTAMLCVFALTANFAKAQDETSVQTQPAAAEATETVEETAQKPEKEKLFPEYEPGKVIMEHVTDAHEWHILTLHQYQENEKHISIPLPIILYCDGHLDVFMSSKFHHGHECYKGYKLGCGEDHEKIVCVDDSGEPIVDEAGVVKAPLDFSLTKVAAELIISCLVLITLVFLARRSCLKNKGKAPRGLQSLMEMAVIFVRDGIAKPLIGEKYGKYLPYLITLFLFIFLSNVLGLIPFFPGGSNLTGNIAVTGVLALITFLLTTFSANKHYWKDIFNTPGVPWWLKFPLPIMPLVEFVGMLIKPFVLMVRLFANITAGHIVTLGFVSLIFIFANAFNSVGTGFGLSPVSLILTLFISALECLVAFIQAYVFTMLSSLYIGMAVAEPEHEKKETPKLDAQKA